MTDGVFLTPEDAERLADLLDAYETGGLGAPGDGKRRPQRPPIEVYLAKTTTTITAADDDVPGTGTIEFWQVNEDDDTSDLTLVLNEGIDEAEAISWHTFTLPTDTFVIVVRDALSGKWIINPPGNQTAMVQCGDYVTSPDGHSKLYYGKIKNLSPGAWTFALADSVYLTEANNDLLIPGAVYLAVYAGDYSDGTPVFWTATGSPLGTTSSSSSGNGVCVVTDTHCSQGGLVVEQRHLTGFVVIGGVKYPVSFDVSQECGSGSS